MERLTKWEGRNVDGSPRAVFVNREGLFNDILQPALVKLAKYEDLEELDEQKRMYECYRLKAEIAWNKQKLELLGEEI